ncbi:hypothetical protein UA08_07151 [Talaromyces atroroseus]|uniref:Uncharacterized protein n=1 Tax=Talaromyces atroroseus TaxID=1441469 RepID=A0A225AVX9_TALAT|nr:hypothetical protein UA08_07151 [Talaromyces atroroseus]OKL57647.1 hypothetical protein UA08_07151 [Talaromyces atroroseus]
MSQKSNEENVSKDGSQSAEEGEIPILLPFRYNPEAEGRFERSPTSDVAPSSPAASHQSRFSFGRRARGMVDSLLPEPLKPRNVAQKRAVKLNQLPANLASESSAAIYNEELHQPRPSSSVYEDDIWPDLTTSSGSTWLYEGSSAGNLKSGRRELREHYPGISDNSKLSKDDTTGNKQTHILSDHGYSSRYRSRFDKKLPSLPPLDSEELQNEKTGQSPQHTLGSFQSPTERRDMYSQLAALRVPIRRRNEPVLPVAAKTNDEKAPLLQKTSLPGATDVTGHVPFDPIDPYHRSGLPKKKVLYGPDGYLGQKQDWKQSNLQKMTEKVESLSNRVKRGIQRSIEPDRDDNRMELLHGIVMKPSISINVDPEAQSEIYSKLELFLCTSANAYLLTQMHNNRFEGNDSVKRFVAFWNSKNRPLVPEFQFDMKTQRDIIKHNVNNFGFPGKFGLDPVLLKATLDGWGSVINQLNVRTYCWPDSAIRKLFHDVYPVLEMLGASKEVLNTFLDMKHLVVGLIHQAKYKKKMEELQRASSVRESL